MIRSIFVSAAAFAAIAGGASAQGMASNPPTETIVCLDVNGQSLPAVCKVPASRLDKREDICTCNAGLRVKAPVCARGMKPPAENVAYDRARKAAAQDGSLMGDLYEGKPMCVAERMSN